MDIPIHRYPWQSQDPVTYIEAYRHVALFARPRPANLRLVWGPAGDRGSLSFWPGADVVDFASFPIYGLPDKDIADYRRQEAFATILARKLGRVRFVAAPVLVAELGVKGPPDYRSRWLSDAARALRESRRVAGVLYFNQHDRPGAWGGSSPPDWSLTPALFDRLVHELFPAGARP